MRGIPGSRPRMTWNAVHRFPELKTAGSLSVVEVIFSYKTLNVEEDPSTMRLEASLPVQGPFDYAA